MVVVFASRRIVSIMVTVMLLAVSAAVGGGGMAAGAAALSVTAVAGTDTASISGSISWQAITGGGSETPNPLVQLATAGDTQGGRSAVIASQTSTDGTYSFTALPAGVYVVKVADQANGGDPNSYYPVTFYGGQYTYEDAKTITLTAGQVSTGDDIHLLVGATVIGKITGKGGVVLPNVGAPMSSVTGVGANLSSSRNDDGGFGFTHLDELKSGSSDASGAVLIRGIAPDTYAFRYAGDDTFGPPGATEYAPSYWKNATFRRDATLLTVKSGVTYTVDQQLSAAAQVSGTVKDRAGTLIQGGFAVLYNTEESTDDTAGIVSTTQIFNGRWDFNLIGPGSYKVGFTQAANGITPAGALAASYPFVSSWYGGTSYSTATSIVVTAGASVENISGIMPYDESFLRTWVAEQSGGRNASEPYCQCFSGDPINDATGEFYLNGLNDIALPGVGPAVALPRTYSSAFAATDGPFGYGWSTALSAGLQIITPAVIATAPPQVVQIIQENGAAVRFTLDVNGVYEAPPRVLAHLTLNGDGSWAFVRRATTFMNFDRGGVLVSVADLHGNTVTYTHNPAGQVVTVTGSGGRQITLTWNGSHVSGATDSAGRAVGYTYDAAGELATVTDVNGTTSSHTYNAAHQMLTTAKPNGGVTSNTYDTTGRIIRQTDPLLRATTWGYSGTTADETTTITTPDGAIHTEHYLNLILASSTVAVGTTAAATMSYQYNEALQVVAKMDALKKSTTYTWDPNGNQLSATTPLHHTTFRQYDALNNVTGVSEPNGNFSYRSYDSAGNLLSSTTAGNSRTSFTYNSDGTLATRTTPNRSTYEYAYTSAGQVSSVTDPSGAVTTSAYNAAGFVTSTTDPLTHTFFYKRDAAGRVLTATDPVGNVTSFSYDADGNRVSTIDPESHRTSAVYNLANEATSKTDGNGHTSTFTYGNNGLPASATDPNGGVTGYLYNAAEQKTQTTNPVGKKTSYRYDLDGRHTVTVNPTGAKTVNAYDADGNRVKVTNPLGKVTTYTYDVDSRQITATDPLGRVTATSYTIDGRPATVTQPGGSSKSWVYDRDGNITATVNADTLTTSYTYDSDDRQTSQTLPGAITTGYTYDSAGRHTATTRPDGTSITLGYDADNHLTSTLPSTAGAVATTFQYGASGERLQMVDPTGITTSTYDAVGQVLTVTNGAGRQVGYAYDAAGHRVKIIYPTGKTVTYGYDKAGQMKSVKDWNAKTSTFTWTADGKQATQVGADRVTEKRAYSTADTLTAITDTTTTGTGTTATTSIIASYGYGYDAAGQLTSDSTTDPNLIASTHNYTYDPLGQLASATTATTTTPYTATPGGELIASATTASATYNAAEQLAALTTAAGASATYSYDPNGQRVSSTTVAGGATSSTGYSHDTYGNLASVAAPSGATVTYGSNGDRLRQSMTSGATTTQLVWDTGSAVPLLLDDGTNSYIYGPSVTPIAQISTTTGATQYLHRDLIGSVRLITTSTGIAVGTTEYDPYGNRTAHSGTADSAIGYTGALTDLITGLVYLRSRNYDPTTGAFLTIDPAVDFTAQQYTYVGNDPLQFADPLGLINGWAIVGAIGLGLAIAALAATGIGIAADVPLVAVESVLLTEITVDTVATIAIDGAVETAVGASAATTEITTVTVATDTATSGFTTAGRVLNAASSGVDAASCFYNSDPQACVAAALGVAGFAGDIGSSLLFRGARAWAGSASSALLGVGAAGIDIGSGAAAIVELTAREGGRSVVRC